MELTDQQREAVKAWLADGASLSDVQKRLKSEFNLTMTYMDVRLLVLDIGGTVKDKPEPKPPKKADPAEPPAYDLDEEDPSVADEPPEGAEPGASEDDPAGEKPGGTAAHVSLSLDRLVVPGAMVSGTVTFSDGVKARWMIDQMGRFGLDPDKPGYRPSNADLQAFQMQLRNELQRNGYA